MGRGEAVVLEAALDEVLPAGALTAKYRPNAPLLAAKGTAAQVCVHLVVVELLFELHLLLLPLPGSLRFQAPSLQGFVPF